MKFKYQGTDSTRKKVEGEIEAKNAAEARGLLRNRRIRPLKIVKAKEPGSGFDLASLMQNDKPSLQEFTAFIRQMATMQNAGIPIVQSLQVLGDQSENKAFGAVLKQVMKAIEEGTSFTEALRRHPRVFDRVFLNLVAAGEVSGALDQVLNRLAIFYEKSAALKRKIISALTYPTLILVLVTAVVIILLYAVVPTFTQMFAGNGKELPEATQMIVKASDFIQANILFILAALAGAVWGIIYAAKDESTRRVIDPLLIKVPILGDLFKKIAIARFARTMGTMIQSGVPILEALEITANVAGNYAVEDAVISTRKSITEGNSISGPLSKAAVFPQMAVSMIAIGEQTGALEAMLTKVAEFYEDEVDAKVGALTSILEPLMIIIVGLVVAGIMIPMYLPVFQMGDAIGG